MQSPYKDTHNHEVHNRHLRAIRSDNHAMPALVATNISDAHVRVFTRQTQVLHVDAAFGKTMKVATPCFRTHVLDMMGDTRHKHACAATISVGAHALHTTERNWVPLVPRDRRDVQKRVPESTGAAMHGRSLSGRRITPQSASHTYCPG